MKIKVCKSSSKQYDVDIFYPICTNAALFSQLGKPIDTIVFTLSSADLKIIERLGVEIEIIY